MNLWGYLHARAERRDRRRAERGVFNFRDVLGAVLVLGFLAVMGFLLWRVIPKDNEQLITYMLGQLSGFVAAVVALHYVTKAGEKEQEAKQTENTGKALDAIRMAQESPPPTPTTDPRAVHEGDTVELHRTEETRP